MERFKMKKLLKWLIPAIIIYRFPIHYSGETVAISPLDGDTVLMQYDITVRRYLFKPTTLSGEMVIDGKRYADHEIFSERYFEEGVDLLISIHQTFWDEIKAKFDDNTFVLYRIDSDPSEHPEFQDKVL